MYDALSGSSLGRLEAAYDNVVLIVRSFYEDPATCPRKYTRTIKEELRHIKHILVAFGRDLQFPQNISLSTVEQWNALVPGILRDLEDVGDGRVEDLCEDFRIAFDKFMKTSDERVARQVFEEMHVALASLEELVGARGVGHIAADVRALTVIMECFGREYDLG